MKRLSDYQGEEAFELWADLMEPLVSIFQDTELRKIFDGRHSYLDMVGAVLKDHKGEVAAIFKRIDPEPIDGSNLIGRLLVMLGDIAKDPILGSFFGLAGPVKTQNDSSGSAMENTVESVK